MDEGGSRIRRRVSVRKRNRPSLDSVSAACPATELKPSDKEKEEEEMEAGSRRRKTVDVQPVEVQLHHLSDSHEFLVLFPSFGVMIQTQVPTARAHWKAWNLKLPSSAVPSQVQAIDRSSTSLLGLTSSLLSLLILAVSPRR